AGVGGHCIAVDPYFIVSAYPEESKIIAGARAVNNYKSEWCVEKVVNAILRFELANSRKPVVALMGLAFKPDIDDLRESPALRIADAIVGAGTGAEILLVEPNIKDHPRYVLTDFREAFHKADIAVMLTAHSCFRDLDKECRHCDVLDFCGVFEGQK
ncbi:MAG: UDP-N-acetyl-D-mannosamine dehydrogenase, partial [Muribaculaceae bacterium]|nr:UDP-N-acetyl-D-mannosamine dehydrogenase [Muribaculaceae bacterium]